MTNDLLNTATQVYVGQDHACRCGCRGTYHEAGSAGFKRAVNRFRKILLTDDADDLTVAETYFNLSFGNDRAICVYFS